MSFSLKMKKNSAIFLKCIDLGTLLLGVILCIYWYINPQRTLMFYGVLLVFGSNVLFCFEKIKVRLSLLLFLAAFFLFLMGRMVTDLYLYGFATFNFEPDISIHILLCLTLSLVFLRIGFVLVERFVKPLREGAHKSLNISKVAVQRKIRLKKISKYMFYIAFICTIPFVLEEFIFIQENSYEEIYKSFSSSIPSIIRIVSNMRNISLFIFLCCFPSKKEVKLPLILLLANGIMQMLTGDRTNLSLALLTGILYFGLREYLNPDEKWVRKRYFIYIIIGVPFLLIFMSFFVYIREGFDTSDVTLTNQFFRFFRSIGRSVDVIGYGKYYESEMPKSIYTIAELTNYIKYNPVTEFLFHNKLPMQHTKEFALGGYSYMHSITYLIKPDLYLTGHGAGSSYIAEAYQDLHYFGVALVNLFYGAFLAFFYKCLKKSPIILGCFIQAINIMFYVPRGAADYPITYILNITTLTAIFIIWMYSVFPELKGKVMKVMKELKDGK